MICEKCEMIGRVNLIPHIVETGENGIAEEADCPWEWEKDEIEEYVNALFVKEMVELYRDAPDPATLDQSQMQAVVERYNKLGYAIAQKCKARLAMLWLTQDMCLKYSIHCFYSLGQKYLVSSATDKG